VICKFRFLSPPFALPLVYFPHSKKMNVGLGDIHAVYVSVFRISEPVLTKLCIYIIALEPILTEYFTNPFILSVCLYVFPPLVPKQKLGTFIARQRLGKHVPVARNRSRIRIIVGLVCL
jgi:hypothetical protein